MLRPQVYRQISLECNEKVFIKVHDAWSQNSNDVNMFPSDITHGVIYIIRNPLDIAVSFAFHSNIPISKSVKRLCDSEFSFCSNPKKLFNQLNQNIKSWSDHATSWIDKSNLPVHIMQFEKMISDPFETFSNALQFLHMKSTEEQIRAAIEKSSFEVLQKLENDNGFREKPIRAQRFFRSGKIDDWKNYISSIDYERLINKNESIMKRFNYL